jgi:hypothetical protein
MTAPVAKHHPRPWLGRIARRGAPLALLTLVAFGCATVRAPASVVEGDVTVGPGGPEPQVELWLESGGPISEEERARGVAEARRALALATEALVSDDGAELLVVRAQGISRTRSRRADQTSAKVGIAVGAVVIVALAVLAIASGKGGGGGGGGALKGAAPRAVGHVASHPPRAPHFTLPSAPSRTRAPRGFVAVGIDVHGPVVRGSGPPQPVAVRDEAPAEGRDEARDGEGQEMGPPSEEVTLHLPPLRPLDVERRKFFDKDFTRLELLAVDRATGRPTWAKTVEGEVDPRDPAAVRALLARALEDRGGWMQLVEGGR